MILNIFQFPLPPNEFLWWLCVELNVTGAELSDTTVIAPISANGSSSAFVQPIASDWKSSR